MKFSIAIFICILGTIGCAQNILSRGEEDKDTSCEDLAANGACDNLYPECTESKCFSMEIEFYQECIDICQSNGYKHECVYGNPGDNLFWCVCCR
eukprot:00539.XXX_2579_2917_1 [CDS] Oithona nana genome sequencing.